MKTATSAALFLALSTAVAPSQAWAQQQRPQGDPLAFFRAIPRDAGRGHAHLMHLDGFRGDLFEKMLAAGQLPHFALLRERGKLSTRASTVDKSETFKVIESYLTARRDTTIAGWWQFNREQLAFRNYWINPVDVLNYELGLDFPVHATVFDVLAAKGEEVTAGFSLHRRSVPYRNYSRNFIEGLAAVSAHTYFDQQHAATSGVIDLIHRAPALSTSLMATADEWGHLTGVVADLERTSGAGEGEWCFYRKPSAKPKKGEKPMADPFEIVFRTIEREANEKGGSTVFVGRTLGAAGGAAGIVRGAGLGHFSKLGLDKKGKRVLSACVRVPKLRALDSPEAPAAGVERHADPRYVLGTIWVDIQLGRLINAMRAVRFECPTLKPGPRPKHCLTPSSGDGIEKYLARGRAEGSLFEQTLFLQLGDHGMADTRYMMAADTEATREYGRRPESIDRPLVEWLASKLELDFAPASTSYIPVGEPGAVKTERGLALDDHHLPIELWAPHRAPGWQDDATRAKVAEARAWATAFWKELHRDVKQAIRRNYWYLFFLRTQLVDPKVDATLDPYEAVVVDLLAGLYLKGDEAYARAEREGMRRYFDEHVRLVHGGGALNNAELFLPRLSREGKASWSSRPEHAQVFGRDGDSRLMEALRENPAVGLIFVRRQNGTIAPGRPLPESLEIDVMDREGNRGLITVRKGGTGLETELRYAYRTLTERDPLGYGDLAQSGKFRTYEEWNDLSLARDHVHHNAVAGMGSYLYSSSEHIGDVSLMHAPGWNFGDNAGGHGGLLRDEKLTVMLASGPGVARGELMAKARDGRLVHPTVVDAAPTILEWLGHGPRALSRFEADGGFERQLQAWARAQEQGFADDFVAALKDTQGQLKTGFELDLSRHRERLQRLLRFMTLQKPRLPTERTPEDGNPLKLD